MKNLIIIPLLALLFFACEGEPRNIELGNAEAFAFYLGDGWELNASLFARNFELKEADDQYHYKISYSASLVTPSLDTLKNIDNDTLEGEGIEEPFETEMELQINLDSNFEVGKYKLLIEVLDEYSNQTVLLEKDFTLSDE